MNLMHEGVLEPKEPDFRDERRELDEYRRKTASEVKLKPCPFCGGEVDVTDYGVTSFIIEPDGGIVGQISCAGCAASVTCAGDEDERCHESDFGCKRLHPIDLWKVAEATKEKWNRRANDE